MVMDGQFFRKLHYFSSYTSNNTSVITAPVVVIHGWNEFSNNVDYRHSGGNDEKEIVVYSFK